MTSNISVDQLIVEQIRSAVEVAVDSAVQVLVDQTIKNLVLDPAWLEKIQTLVDQHMTQRVLLQLSMIDVNSAVADATKENFDRWKQELEQIVDSPGIKDSADSLQLSVMNQLVVVENELVSNNLSVENTAEIKGDLVVNNLVVRGAVNTDNRSWDELADVVGKAALEKITPEWQNKLVQQVLDSAKASGIDFGSITVNGTPVISGNTLNNSITQTGITSVGDLERLSVRGPAQINDTFNVLNRRVGINTEDPEMALSVWDEDVSVVIGKFSKQHGYIGTARAQNLSIGVNRIPQIEIDTDGLTTIKQLRVGQHRIGFAREVPGYSGTRGDIVFNMDPKPGSPFAWQCLGSFQWQPINFTTTS